MASILIIDDSSFTRGKIRDALKAGGYEILEADDGNKGLKIATTQSPDCILLDIIIPGLDGLKVLKSLQEQNSKIPVVVITADIQESTYKQCLDLGATAVMNKPHKDDDLRRAVQGLLKYKNPPTLTDKQFDTLKELINIGVGRAAGVLNEMTHSHVTLEVPYIKILSPSDLRNEMAGLSRDKVAAVQLNFNGPFSGIASLVFPPNSASMLVSVLTEEGRWTSDMNSLKTATLSEVGNIVINGVMGSICNVLKEHLSFSMPAYIEDTVDNLLKVGFASIGSTALLAQTRFKIKKLQIEGDIILLFEVGSFDSLLAAIDAITGTGENV